MRSRPLVLDKKGNPTVVSVASVRYPAWKLMIRDNVTGKRKTKLYAKFKKARKVAKKLQEEYGDRIEVCVVSRQMGYGPPQSLVSDVQLLAKNEIGQFWCPYCRKFRKFLYSPRLECRVCEFCHTMESDWHVHRNNPILWEPEYFKRMFY